MLPVIPPVEHAQVQSNLTNPEVLYISMLAVNTSNSNHCQKEVNMKSIADEEPARMPVYGQGSSVARFPTLLWAG